MACCSTKEKTYGYDDTRFEKDVDENFHCSICYNVLKEPRMCRNNEHLFCLACISEHLRVNSQTCPECNDHLSVDTLRRARVVKNFLSKLKINCDHASRGCPELTCLEDLETHVVNCGYAPVLCSNAECGMVINKQDRVHHETAACEYKSVKCHDCGQIQEDMGTLKESLMKLVEQSTKEIRNNHVEIKKVVEKLEGNVIKLNGKVEAVQEQVKKEVSDVKESISKVSNDVDEVKVMMIQILEKFNMLEQMNKLPSPAEEMLNAPREEILIAGGLVSGKSCEIFSWEKNRWFEASAMNKEHCAASSFIYNNHVYVVGGEDSKTIETLDLNKLPLKWKKYRGQLPDDLAYYKTVVYQQCVIRIGGYDGSSSSDVISEWQLSPHVTVKKLCKMPQPRDSHGAEIFEDKILILGGEDGGDDGDDGDGDGDDDDGDDGDDDDYGDGDVDGDDHDNVLNSVLEFDVKKNECKEMPPLPRPLARIATIRWRDQVVVLGGLDEDDQVLNDVFMYDSKTGKTTTLPSMLEKRCKCCAVITGNTIVVMGGVSEKEDSLKSVECFTMGGYTWEYLPDMNKERCRAIAEVLPCGRKYV